jgi:hypothetical protein
MRFWPRMFYRSGWLRCVGFICIGFCWRMVFVLAFERLGFSGWVVDVRCVLSWWKVVDVWYYIYIYIITHIHIHILLYIIILYIHIHILIYYTLLLNLSP